MLKELGVVEVSRLHRLDGESKTKAFVDITLGDFVIKGLRVVEGEKGLFVSMPQEKGKDGKWYDTFSPKSKEVRQELADLILEVYRQE